MKVCPSCGRVVSYNSYFSAYICTNCNWEERQTRNRVRELPIQTKNASTASGRKLRYVIEELLTMHQLDQAEIVRLRRQIEAMEDETDDG